MIRELKEAKSDKQEFKKKMISGRIFNIQHFSNDDGPGIRTTVFFQGCNLRCPWCHNPESQSFHTEIMHFPQKCIGCGRCIATCPNQELFTEHCKHCGKCAESCPADALVSYGKEMTVEEVAAECVQDMDLYEMSGGGVTVSGGEPLLQIEFLEAVLKALKAEGIHTAIETAGCYDGERLKRILPYTDLVFMDLKCLDAQKHAEVIGASNEQIINNIYLTAQSGTEFVIRTPVICGFNEMELPAMAKFIKQLPAHVKAELLPYHEICSGKYDALHRKFNVGDFRVPTQKEMDSFQLLYGERLV